MNLLRWQVYTALGAACLLAFVALILSRWQVSISIEEAQPQTSPVSLSADEIPTEATASSLTKPTPAPTLRQLENDRPLNNLPSTAVEAYPGALRLSNQTNYPVRIAFLSRRVGAKSTKQSAYGEPAHWDFAPREGASNGLILSLPKGIVKLEKGDLLVAFAQDGSGRYWGPYIVGETTSPVWNSQKSEWHLILQP